MEWISINEKLPEELIPVFGLIPIEDHEMCICVYEESEGFYLSYDGSDISVEYWAPIPDELMRAWITKKITSYERK